MVRAFRYIKANDGIDTEESYPYIGFQNIFCLFNKDNVGATCTGEYLGCNDLVTDYRNKQ